MALLLKYTYDAYQYIDHDLSDPRTRQYYIILNPIFLLVTLVAYHKFIYSWGPKFMENRKPFKLEKVLLVYNALQIVFSLYIFAKSVQLVWWSGYYSLKCQPICRDDTPLEHEINKCCRLYYLIKLADLLDTIFFILRKKYNQATFLHVYHHIGMSMVGFVCLKYVPAGHGTALGTVNSFVHIIMYFYYLISCINPEYKRSVWWKKYITQLQIAQFLILTIHFAHVLFQPSCEYPKWISLAFLPQNFFILIMFVDFYIKAYVKKKKIT